MNSFSDLFKLDPAMGHYAGESDDFFLPRINSGIPDFFNMVQESLRCYTFSLITRGSLKILYNGNKVDLKKYDLYYALPGYSMTTIEVSDDFESFTLFVNDKTFTDISIVHKLLHASFFSQIFINHPKIELNADVFPRLMELMVKMDDYLHSSILLKSEAMRLTFSLFLVELINNRRQPLMTREISQSAENIFIGFMQLLPVHFIDHHDVAFYARTLKVSSVYLSRVVKKISGITVVSHIDRLLAMEAALMLRSTRKTVAEISEALNFANQSGFSRFFFRMKGRYPSDFRKSS